MGKFIKIIQDLICLLFRMYRYLISPFFGKNCRFYPSCSMYAEQALEEHGILYGGILTLRRILKCHPWHEGGVDPVPLNRNKCRN